MPIPVVCAACQTKLTAPDAAAGKKVKCKNCQAVIAVPEPEESDFEFVDAAPVPAAKPVAAKHIAAKPIVAAAVPAKPKPAVVSTDEYHDEFDFDAPAKKSKSKVVVEDDEDDAPKPKKKSKAAIAPDGGEDDIPKPSKKKKKPAVLDDDEDADEDDAPRKVKKGKRKPEKKKGNPLIFVALGLVALLAFGAIGGAVWYFVIRDDKGGIVAGTNSTSPNAVTLPPLPLSGVLGSSGWTKVDRPHFSVQFKDSFGTPKLTQAKLIDKSDLDSATAGDLKTAMMAECAIFPPEELQKILAKQDPFEHSESKLGGLGTILTRKTISIDGHSGREAKIQKPDGEFVFRRTVFAHNRVYIFTIAESGITESSDAYRTFFDSIKLKP